VIDAPAMLGAIAARTTRIRLGTDVYLLGLRHPLISARVWTTVDMISAGRVLLGVGAGWLESEWAAAGLDWRTRGRALDEAIEVCRRLWREAEVEHRGQTWSFEPVTFEPKPVQPGGPPIHVGGESEAAQRRAVRRGGGWIALEHTPATIRPKVERLRALLAAAGRDPRDVPVTAVGAAETAEDLAAWSKAGVDHLIVTPWRRSATAVDDLAEYARRLGIGLR
jgi:probable F420-dependent oxidoreductase